MKDRHTQSDDWISEWIARQRDLLSQKAARPDSTAEANPAEIFRRWLDMGRAYFDAPQRPAGESDANAAFSDPFDVSSALLGAWTNAGVFQAGIAQQASDLLGRLPPIGLAREQTEAWRELAAAHARCQQIENELRAVLLKVQFDALDLLSERIRERPAADPIDGFRALYDLWVECGEQVYGKLAHSDAYSKLQAELGNATMKVRSRMQSVIEHALKQFDLPSRSELNSLHRQVRELRIQVEQMAASSNPAPTPGRKTVRARSKPPQANSARPAASRAKAKRRRK